jgi:hypothetical protein
VCLREVPPRYWKKRRPLVKSNDLNHREHGHHGEEREALGSGGRVRRALSDPASSMLHLLREIVVEIGTPGTCLRPGGIVRSGAHESI